MFIWYSAYFVSSLFFLGVSSMLLCFFFLEILSWVFSLFLPLSSPLKYLMIQGIFLFSALMSLLFYPKMIFFSFLLKMGLPPFHIWFFSFSSLMTCSQLIFFITFHKIIPLIFFCFISMFYYITFLVVLPFVLVFFMISFSSFFTIFLCSSMVHSSWLMTLTFLNLGLFFLYWVFYSFLVVLFCNFFFSSFFSLFDSNQTLMTTLMWSILSGFPPFLVFWLKVLVLDLIIIFSFFVCFVLIMTSFISLTSYYRIFHISVLSFDWSYFKAFLIPFLSLSVLGFFFF